MLIINFKAYSKGTGKEARGTAKKCINATEDMDHELIISPQPEDILRIDDLDTEIYSQHITSFKPGSHTGHPVAEGLKDAGASGTLLNHSERRITDKEMLERTIERAEANDMTTVVCAQTPEDCEEISQMNPDYVAFEPPELIGGDKAVSEAEPELIEEAYERSEAPLLAGAGIKDSDDVEKAIELGCEGVLVASGVVKSDKPGESARELMSGL